MPEQQQQHSNKIRIEVDGQALPEQLETRLVGAVVDDSLNLPDLFVLSFRDPERAVLEQGGFRIGATVKVAVVSEAGPTGEELIHGEVTALEIEADSAGTTTVVRGLDHAHRLFRGRVTESYTDVTYSDVARKVAQRVRLEVGRIDPTATVHPLVSQVNVCDWQFLTGLAAEIGYEVAVLDGKFEFRAPTDSGEAPSTGELSTQDPLQLTLGANLLRLHAILTSAEQVTEVKVRGWDVAKKQELIGSAPAQTANAELTVTPGELAGTFGDPGYVGVDVPFRTQAEVDAAAKAVADQIAGAFAEVEGVARGNPKLRAGTAVSLGLAGRPFDGKYTLTATRHVYDPEEGYTTRFTVSGRQERSLLGLASGGGRQGNGVARPIQGVAVAQVTDVGDPEDQGRVRLRFPWLSDAYVTDWVRTVQPGAGADRGAVVLPEVDDEVLVAFEQGDVRRPYLLGGLFNGVDTPRLGDRLIDASTGAVNRRGFISRKGHCLVFLDGDGDEGVAILSGDRGLRVSLNQSTTTLKLTSSGNVEIQGSRDVTIKAGGSLRLEATSAVELKGTKVAVTGSGPVEVKGNPIQLN
jgi:phage protein D